MAQDTTTASPTSVSTFVAAIERLLATTRRLLRSTWVTTGLLVAVGLCVAMLVTVTLLDLAVPLWPTLRLVGLVLITLPTMWVLFVGVLRPLLRRLTQVMVARRIEQELPGIHNRLVSCVDLTHNGQVRHSRAFHQRLVEEAYERVKSFRPSRVLDLLSLRRATIFALTSLAALAVAFLLFSDRLPTAMARILQPFADIPPASGVLYDVLAGDRTEPGDYETLRGEDVSFVVVLRQGEVDPPGGQDPLRLVVQTVDEKGRPKSLSYEFAALRENRTSFTLTGMQRSFTYRVHGGGTWSKQFRVTMLDRPRIVGTQTALHYPEYMRKSEPWLGPPQSLDVTGPRESTVEVRLDVEGDASEGEIVLLEQQTRAIAVTERPERVWFRDEMPAGAAKQGDWLWDETAIKARAHTDAAKADGHGHGFERAPTSFVVQPEESLFAYVYIPPDQVPETIMLKFHDGSNWEHRAYWGADKIGEGKPDSPSRLRVGDLPPPGQLVRLEVPAQALDLAGKRIQGVNFALFGGQAIWGATGALPPAEKQVTELVPTESFLLSPKLAPGADQNRPDDRAVASQWSGKFPLLRDGFYRVVLRNQLGYANQELREGKLIAIPDRPPQVIVERPVKDLVVSEPIKVPIYISAFDDFGLDDVVISVQKEKKSATFAGRPVKHYDEPPQSDNTVVLLDLAEEGLELNQTLRYRVEVRDTKGQSIATEDHTIRLAKDDKAADLQLAKYQEKTESLEEKLEQLVEQQAQIEQQAEQLAEKYEPLAEKLEAAQAEAAQQNPNPPADQPPPPLTLDEPTQQQLQALHNELAQVAQAEAQATQLSQQVAGELKQLAEEAAQLQILPPEIAEQVQGVQQAFEATAVQPLQQLTAEMQANAQAADQSPELTAMADEAGEVQQTLEDFQERIEAIVEATATSRTDVNQAVAELQEDILRQNAELTRRELQQLQDAVAEMRGDLGELIDDQAGLMEDAAQPLSDPLFEKLAEAQEQLNAEAEPVLADVGELLGSEMLEQIRAEAQADVAVPANEDAGVEPAEPMDLPLFEPALGGPLPAAPDDLPKAKLAEKAKAEPKGKTGEATPVNPQRQQFQSQQMAQAAELNAADQSLAADQATLEELLEKLGEQLPAEGVEDLAQDQAAELAALLNAETTRDALAMFERLEEMLAEAESPNSNQPSQAALTQSQELQDIGNEQGVIGGVDAILLKLDDFDLNARTIIMKMQPREREELLQGLREEGPAGYREFIRDYFRRLTKVQAEKK